MPFFLKSSSIGKNLLLLFLVHFIFDFFHGIWPIYKTICSIDIATAGLIAGISGFFGESLQMFFGHFCDKGFRKQILLFGLLMGSSILWITFANGLISYFIILLLLKTGSGAFHPASTGYAGALTTQHKSKTILLFASGGLFGLACSQMIFTQVLSNCNGQALLLFIPVAIMTIWILFHSFPSTTPIKNTSLNQMFSNFAQNKKTLTLLYLSQLCSYAAVLSLIFLLPDVLLTKSTDAWLLMGGGHFCFILGGAFALPPMGYLCDRYGQKNLILCALSSGLIFLYLLISLSSLNILSACVLLFFLGASLNSVNPMIVSWGHKVAPNSPSTISALLMGLAWCFSHLGPLGSGALYKMFSENKETQTLLCLGLSLALSLTLTLFTPAKEPATQKVKATS